MNCNCPDDGILVDIDPSDCPFDLKQIQRLAFATKGKVIWNSANTDPVPPATGDGVPQVDSRVDTLADWQLRRSAVDNTKIIVTPLIGGDPMIAPGEAITEGGGDNTTLNGVAEVTGKNPSTFTATWKSITPEQETSFQAISCKTTEVYFFNEDGDIVCEKIPGTDHHKGIDMQSYFFSDRQNDGFGTKDRHTMSFSLKKNWSNNIVKVKPADFNPLYDI